MEQIARIGTNLRDLNLSNTRVSSAGVEALAGCVPNLECLSLSHTAIDDFAIVFLSMMPALEAIDLSHTSIKGIYSLRKEWLFLQNFEFLWCNIPWDAYEIVGRSSMSCTCFSEFSFISMKHFNSLTSSQG